MKRSRPVYAFLILLVMAAGWASRSELAGDFPGFLVTYSGDTLWALMVFLLVGFFFSKTGTPVVAVVALAFCFTIETSQLYQGEWLNQIRATRPGALVLGVCRTGIEKI